MKLSKHFKRSLSGASIMESVIAIAIISICALVAFIIYLNVIQSNKTTSYYEALHVIKGLTQECIYDYDYEDHLYTYKTYKIDKTVEINKKENIAIIEWKIITASKTKVVSNIIPYDDEAAK